MLDLSLLGEQVAQFRRTKELSQSELARQAGISRATLDALENGRARELGFTKLTKLLAALGLEFKLQAATAQRPTLDELLREEQDDQSLDSRR